MTIEAVYFDAVGTVIHPRPGAPRVYTDFARRFGVTVSEVDVRRRITEAFLAEEKRDSDAGWLTSESRERDRWRRIVEDSLPEVPDSDACFRELFEHFARPESWLVDAGVPATFAALRGRGIPFGIASNYDSRLRQVLAGFQEFASVPIFISSELGVRKPAEAFFDALSPELPREQILFVGDDFGNDYRGASHAGLTSVLFDPARRHPDERCVARLFDALHLAIG